MSDLTTILIANFDEALKQINTYVTLGVTSAVSALVLDRSPQDSGNLHRALKRRLVPTTPDSGNATTISVPGVLVPISPETAKWVLVGVCFVVGAMASYAAESAVNTARMLQTDAETFKAACTFPSLATAPIGMRLLAALAPIAFVAPIMWHAWSLVRVKSPNEGWGGLIALVGAILIPYGALGLALSRLPC